MDKHTIITIGRQVGSGGREIGKILSEKLGIPVYDNEILAEASKKSGYTQELFEKHDEKSTGSFLYSLAMGLYNYGQPYQKPLLLEVYLAQFETIRNLAQQGPGIFIGRCSDYVLRDVPNAFHVFVQADMETRVKRIMETNKVDAKKAEDICVRGDKNRASYYNYYANEQWGDSRHYDLCLNTGKLGIEKAAELIISCIK